MTKPMTCLTRKQTLRTNFLFALVISMLLASCSLDFINAKPARDIKSPPQPKGDMYAGWRVFQDKCSSCHGNNATGGDSAPDLLPIVHNMNAQHFSELVLNRYDLEIGIRKKSANPSTIDEQINEIMRRSEPPIEMPAWQGNPAVSAHILDLYIYLSARAEGQLGTQRPYR